MPRPKAYKIPREQIKAEWEAYCNGTPVAELAKRERVSPNTILLRFDKQGYRWSELTVCSIEQVQKDMQAIASGKPICDFCTHESFKTCGGNCHTCKKDCACKDCCEAEKFEWRSNV